MIWDIIDYTDDIFSHLDERDTFYSGYPDVRDYNNAHNHKIVDNKLRYPNETDNGFRLSIWQG